jgi:hypothetical protein
LSLSKESDDKREKTFLSENPFFQTKDFSIPFVKYI